MKYITKKEGFEDDVREDQIRHIKAKEVTIKTKKPMSLDTDGEVYLKTPIKVKVVNKKYTFIVG